MMSIQFLITFHFDSKGKFNGFVLTHRLHFENS
jgi:hypothetical protein